MAISLSITPIASLPLPLKGAGCSIIHLGDGKLLIAGGTTTGDIASNRAFIYNINTNAYTEVANIPISMARPSVAQTYSATSGYVIVVQGASVYQYVLSLNTWGVKTSPVDLTGATTLPLYTNYSLFFGGNYSANTYVQRYRQSAWGTPSTTVVPPTNTNYPQILLNTGENSAIVLAGGRIASTNAVTANSYKYNALTQTLAAVGSLNTARTDTAGGTFSDLSSIIVGGETASGTTASIESFNPTTEVWSTETAVLPVATSQLASAVVGDSLYVFGGRDSAGNILNTAYVISLDDTAPSISFSPDSGYFNTTQNITLTPSETSTIYYTLDGSTPTTSSSVYSAPLSISTTTTIKAFAVDTALNVGTIYTKVYTIDTIPPTAEAIPSSGVLPASGGNITLTASETSNFYYTLDGSTPTIASTFYTGPINITEDTTLKFIAVDLAGNESTVYTAVYVIDATAPILSFSHDLGLYTLPLTFYITSNEAATIFYTTDYSDPITNSNFTRVLYTGAFTVDYPCVIKAYGTDFNGNISAVYTTVIGDSSTGLFLSLLSTTNLMSPNNMVSSAFLQLTSSNTISSPHSLNVSALLNLTSNSELNTIVSLDNTSYITLTSTSTMTNVNGLAVSSYITLYSSTTLSPVTTNDLVYTVGVNTTTAGHFTYSNYPFNSLFTLNGITYGTSNSGIYVLTGTKDIDANISWEVRTVLSGFGSAAIKYIQDAYTTLRAYGDVFFKLLSGESTERSGYTIAFDDDSGLHRRRVKTHKGLRANNWQVSLSGDSQAEVVDTNITINESKRSIK